MAIYHLSATAVQRSKGQSAVAGAAYRAGEKLFEERTGLTHDYTRKGGIVQSEIIAPGNAPAWTHDREQLWNRAEAAERQHNGQPAREIRLGLPAELTDAERADLVFTYARDMFVSEGMIADISIHRPDRHGDQRNHHAHIMLTMRELDGEEFATRKQREWNRTETLEHWREQWEMYQNAALEDAGSDARVDHRSYEAQGISREPTLHLGKDASAMEREGIATRIGDENRDIEAHNRRMVALVSELAEVEAEIARELENDFSLPTVREPEPHPALGGQARPTWEERKQAAQSAFSSEVTHAYMEQAPPTPEQEQRDRERRWYEAFYDRTVEPLQPYWSRFVERIRPSREREGREQYERER